MLHGARRAVVDPFMQRALLELALLGVVGGALGCWIVLYDLSYSAESLAHALFPGLVVAALLGLPLLARWRGRASLGRGRRDRRLAAARRRSAATPRSAIVVTTLFGLGVVLALSPALAAGPRTSCCSATCSASRGADLAFAAGARPSIALLALAVLPPAAAGRRLRPRQRPRARRARRRSPTSRCWPGRGRDPGRRRRGSATCSCVAVIVGPAATARLLDAADGADDGARRAASRVPPARSASTSPTTRTRPAARRSPP